MNSTTWLHLVGSFYEIYIRTYVFSKFHRYATRAVRTATIMCMSMCIICSLNIVLGARGDAVG
jgi:hypothetical protein